MSPEQIRGERLVQAPISFPLAWCLFYERWPPDKERSPAKTALHAGRCDFEPCSRAQCTSWNPGVPPKFAEIIGKALEKIANIGIRPRQRCAPNWKS